MKTLRDYVLNEYKSVLGDKSKGAEHLFKSVFQGVGTGYIHKWRGKDRPLRYGIGTGLTHLTVGPAVRGVMRYTVDKIRQYR